MTLPRPAKAVAIALVVLASGANCGISLNVTPPPEAVLLGAWTVTFTPDTGVNETLVFNEVGRLIERRIKVGSTTVSQTDVHRLTRVTGNAVHIETTDNNVFDGTLNADKNVISGTFSTVLTIGGTMISTENGGATLTKQ